MTKSINTTNISQLILDLTVCSFFATISMLVMTLIIPNGITNEFLIRSYKIISLIFFFLICIFLLSLKSNRNFKFKKKISYPKLKDFILLCLPLSPVIGYIILNIEYLNFSGVIYVFSLLLIFILILSFIVPILLSYIATFEIIMISGLAISFTVLNMSVIYKNPQNYLFDSLFITQGSYLIVSFTLLYLIYNFNKKVAYTVVFVFLLSGIIQKTLNLSFSENFSLNRSNSSRLDDFLSNSKNDIIRKKDIYVLVYESYADLQTLNKYGFDNSEQIKFLKDNKFKVYSGIYSNGATSISSTSRILELKEQLSKHGRYYISGNSFINKILKANGYKNIGLFHSPYFFISQNSWDEYYPKEEISKIGGKIILKAIFEGEFRFDIFSDNYNYNKYLDLKENYLTSKLNQPLFFYSHNALPGHSQNSGKCSSYEKKNYFERVKKANIEMKNDVNNIKKNNHNALIVLVSDHGPYLTKNCGQLFGINREIISKHDIQDRYGVFLAIYWPEELKNNSHNIEISQDIFPAILESLTSNKNLFEELKLKREFFDNYEKIVSGVNVKDGILRGGKDDDKPLFNKRSYMLLSK